MPSVVSLPPWPRLRSCTSSVSYRKLGGAIRRWMEPSGAMNRNSFAPNSWLVPTMPISPSLTPP
ncbi:hypothetical protein D3C83_314400 [compost metagenome]